MVRGEPGAIQDIKDKVHQHRQFILKNNVNRTDINVQLDMIHNMRNTSIDVYNENNTDINENMHVDGETFKLRGNKI